MPTIPVLDANDNLVDIELPNTNGRRSAALSRPVALSNEDLAAIGEMVANGAGGNVWLEEILTALLAGLAITNTVDVNVASGEVSATFAEPFPGYKPGDNVTVVDGSARILWTQTVVTGSGSAAAVLAANANRKGVIFLPAGAANDWIYNFYGTAAAGASPIYPPDGGPLVFLGRGCPTGALSLLGTAGQKLIVWEGN